MATHSVRDHEEIVLPHHTEAVFVVLPFLTNIRHSSSPKDPTHAHLSFLTADALRMSRLVGLFHNQYNMLYAQLKPHVKLSAILLGLGSGDDAQEIEQYRAQRQRDKGDAHHQN